MTEVKPCTGCKETIAAKQQDSMYGKGMRVHNQIGVKSDLSSQYRCAIYQCRCTICGQVRN